MNTVYGGVKIAGNNIVFPSGSIDPWHALGVTQDMTTLAEPSETPLYIIGTSHCQDLKAPKSTDIPALTQARQVIADQVSIWLSDSSNDNKSSNNNDDDGLSTSAQIGIASAVIIVVLSAVIIGVFFAWKRTVANKNDHTENTLKNPLV